MGSYRLTDFTMARWTNSFYVDKGYTLTEVAAVVKAYGLAASVVGVILAGMVMAKIGLVAPCACGASW
jgi:PAT family beta-lactamase induction signal transducer AmpG